MNKRSNIRRRGFALLAILAVFASTLVSVGPADAQTPQKPADVVFAIDESGSMGPVIAAVKANVALIAQALASGGVDAKLGLVGYGATGSHDPAGFGPHIHTPLTDVAGFDLALDDLVASGSVEPAYDATVTSTSDAMGFRPDSGVCVVLITDEFSNGDTATEADALAALNGRNGGAAFFGIGSAPANLATSTGGFNVTLGAFNADPAPVLNALLAGCAQVITQGDCSGDYAVGWPDERLTRNGHRQTPKVAVSIPDGLYDITLTSFDGEHAAGVDIDQTDEEWYLEVFRVKQGKKDKLVYRSPAIDDLADDETRLEMMVDSGVELDSGGEYKVRARHAAKRGSHSIVPLCAQIEPIAAP